MLVFFLLCINSQKQMNFLESQKNDGLAAKEEAKRLRVKMKTYERYKLCLVRQNI